jgi:hypothetical protein
MLTTAISEILKGLFTNVFSCKTEMTAAGMRTDFFTLLPATAPPSITYAFISFLRSTVNLYRLHLF